MIIGNCPLTVSLSHNGSYQLDENPVVRVEPNWLAQHVDMSVLPADYEPLAMSPVGLWTYANTDPTVAPFGGRQVQARPIAVSSWPRACRWTGPLVSDIVWCVKWPVHKLRRVYLGNGCVVGLVPSILPDNVGCFHELSRFVVLEQIRLLFCLRRI